MGICKSNPTHLLMQEERQAATDCGVCSCCQGLHYALQVGLFSMGGNEILHPMEDTAIAAVMCLNLQAYPRTNTMTRISPLSLPMTAAMTADKNFALAHLLLPLTNSLAPPATA